MTRKKTFSEISIEISEKPTFLSLPRKYSLHLSGEGKSRKALEMRPFRFRGREAFFHKPHSQM